MDNKPQGQQDTGTGSKQHPPAAGDKGAQQGTQGTAHEGAGTDHDKDKPGIGAGKDH